MKNKLLQQGGKLWEKIEKGISRVYFNDLLSRIGLTVNRYGTGNISSASLNGESISNSSARKIESILENGKFYYDLISGLWVTDGLDDYREKLITSVKI